MSELKVLTTQKLRELIDSTETTLDELNAELERREELRQHQEIGRLDEHMKNAELSLTTIRDYIAYVLEGIRKDRA